MSYLTEGLNCFIGGHHKAAAVMIGGATESLVIELRDSLVQRLGELGLAAPSKLNDWRIKIVQDELQKFIGARKATLSVELREAFSSYWPAFTQQIRVARNDAGHPSSVDPVSPETAHALFLMFPLLAKLAANIHTWITDQVT